MADDGPDCDRSHDRLGASDQAIVEFRKQMLDAVREFQQGAEAIGTGSNAIPAEICAFQAVIPKTEDWRTTELTYVWADGVERPVLEASYSVTP